MFGYVNPIEHPIIGQKKQSDQQCQLALEFIGSMFEGFQKVNFKKVQTAVSILQQKNEFLQVHNKIQDQIMQTIYSKLLSYCQQEESSFDCFAQIFEQISSFVEIGEQVFSSYVTYYLIPKDLFNSLKQMVNSIMSNEAFVNIYQESSFLNKSYLQLKEALESQEHKPDLRQ